MGVWPGSNVSVVVRVAGCRLTMDSLDRQLDNTARGTNHDPHLNGSFLAIEVRRTDSLTSSRTTNVPTAPMLTTPNFANSFAIRAG